MVSDLTERLRAHDLNISPGWDEANDQHLWCDTADALLSEAADEIDRLTAALAEAREALEPFAKASVDAGTYYHDTTQVSKLSHVGVLLTLGELRAARAISDKIGVKDE